jgi:FAD dependent oxidoreductase
MLGVCTALELARSGLGVDLFDRRDMLLSHAATRNEGKIHLGYVYAKGSLRTAEIMVDGGLRFWPVLRRHLGDAVSAIPVSDPFVYAVPRDSQLALDRIFGHAQRIGALLVDRAAAVDYPGGDLQVMPRCLSAAEVARSFNPATVIGAILTGERAVEVNAVARLLRAVVADEPRIRVHLENFVQHAEWHPRGGLELTVVRSGEARRVRHETVVNALWDGRLALDRSLGLSPELPWLWRLKYAIRVFDGSGPIDLPSFTGVLGMYGDFVQFPGGTLYLSWYPVCLQGKSAAVDVPPWPREKEDCRATAFAEAALRGLTSLAPALGEAVAAFGGRRVVHGGIIYAAGETDIDDTQSGLHRRDRVGIVRRGGWLSVDPGKYSLAPWFAEHVAADIVGISPC